jgi:hypothetical protein
LVENVVEYPIKQEIHRTITIRSSQKGKSPREKFLKRYSTHKPQLTTGTDFGGEAVNHKVQSPVHDSEDCRVPTSVSGHCQEKSQYDTQVHSVLAPTRGFDPHTAQPPRSRSPSPVMCGLIVCWWLSDGRELFLQIPQPFLNLQVSSALLVGRQGYFRSINRCWKWRVGGRGSRWHRGRLDFRRYHHRCGPWSIHAVQSLHVAQRQHIKRKTNLSTSSAAVKTI